MTNNYTSTTETFFGYIETTRDSLLLFEACKRGIIPRISRRLQDKERHLIRSGSIFCFDENESGIKRWTDGFVWSPSRIMGNFLIYRELEDKKLLRSYSCDRNTMDRSYSFNNINSTIKNRSKSFGNTSSEFSATSDLMKRQREKSLIGSLKSSYKFKKNGLIKKSMSLIVDGVQQHIISYYNKDDVLLNKLITPSSITELSKLEVSPGLRLRQNFRIPIYTTEDNFSDDGYLDVHSQSLCFTGDRRKQFDLSSATEIYPSVHDRDNSFLFPTHIPHKEDSLYKEHDSRYTALSDYSDSSGGYSSADISQNAIDEATSNVLTMQDHTPLMPINSVTPPILNLMEDKKGDMHVISHLASVPVNQDDTSYHNKQQLKPSKARYQDRLTNNRYSINNNNPYFLPQSTNFFKELSRPTARTEKDTYSSNTSLSSSDKHSSNMKIKKESNIELPILGTSVASCSPHYSNTNLIMGSTSSGYQLMDYHQDQNPHQNLFLASSFHNMTQPSAMAYRNNSIINAYTFDINMLLSTHEDEFEFQL